MARSPLAQLERLGRVQGGQPPQPQAAGSVAEASAKVGFAVKQPDLTTLPAGLERTPKMRVIPAHEIRFTFDAAKTREYITQLGRTNVVLPNKFDGASLIVSFPAAAVLEYAPPGSGDGKGQLPSGLLVGQSEPDQKPVQLLAPAVEAIDPVVAPEFLDP